MTSTASTPLQAQVLAIKILSAKTILKVQSSAKAMHACTIKFSLTIRAAFSALKLTPESVIQALIQVSLLFLNQQTDFLKMNQIIRRRVRLITGNLI